MGLGWAVSSFAPFLGKAMIDAWSLEAAFAGFAAIMVAAGAVSLALPKRFIHESAQRA